MATRAAAGAREFVGEDDGVGGWSGEGVRRAFLDEGSLRFVLPDDGFVGEDGEGAVTGEGEEVGAEGAV